MFRRIKAADYATRACFIPHLLLLLLPSTLCFSMGPELQGRNAASLDLDSIVPWHRRRRRPHRLRQPSGIDQQVDPWRAHASCQAGRQKAGAS
jgi:hypothetical protein